MSRSERVGMVDSLDSLSICRQCKALSISRSSVYYKPTEESSKNLEIMRLLDEQYLNTPFYGAKRLMQELLAKGYSLSIGRLRRLMKKVNWRTIYPKKRTTMPDPCAYKFPYLLQGLTIDRINQVWAIDITYIPMKKGFMYLFAVIDVYSRYVVSWSLSNTMNTDWVVETLKDAFECFGPPEIINSDQGAQFTSNGYIELLQGEPDKGIPTVKISMDGKGRALDNIYIERLWRSVKYEDVYIKAYETVAELRKGLTEYFSFYNKKRRHQSLNYQTPGSYYWKAA